MKKLFVLMLVLIISFSFCAKKKDGVVELAKKPLMVKVQKVQRGSLVKYLNYKGTVSAWKTANIVPEASGRIGRIYKKQGDWVKQGDLLAELDITSLQLQQKQAKAAADVTQAAYKDAQLNYERMKKMYENKAISQYQYEKTQLALEAADTQWKNAKATLDLVNYTLEKSYMRAPFSGVIAAKLMEEGDFINPMMGMGQMVLILMDLAQVKIQIDIPVEDVQKVQVGQKCLVSVSSQPNENFFGKVYSKNLVADPMSKTFKVEVVVANPDLKINAGVFADVSVEVLRQEKILRIPLSALLPNNLVVLYENGKAKKVQVTVGLRNGTWCEIRSGLQENDQVVSEGNYDLKDGSLLAIEGESQ